MKVYVGIIAEKKSLHDQVKHYQKKGFYCF